MTVVLYLYQILCKSLHFGLKYHKDKFDIIKREYNKYTICTNGCVQLNFLTTSPQHCSSGD